MRVFRTDGSGRPDGIMVEEIAEPRPDYDQVAVRMRAVSLNFLDLKVIAGKFPGGKAGLVPFSDGAGEVVQVGPSVTHWKPGDRVTSTFFPLWQAGPITDAARRVIPGATTDGVLQDVVLFKSDAVVRAPDHLDWEQAATLPCAALTAWQLFTGPRPVLPGETVLIEGTGGVSIFALQFARLAGARVIATSSSQEKAERLRALGAEAVIDYRSIASWGQEVRRLTGGEGADHIIDVGEADTLAQSIAAAAVNAQILLVGRPVGAPAIDPALLMAAMATYRRISVGSRADFLAMDRAISAHRLEPVIARRFSVADLADALRAFSQRAHFGKIVVSLS